MLATFASKIHRNLPQTTIKTLDYLIVYSKISCNISAIYRNKVINLIINGLATFLTSLSLTISSTIDDWFMCFVQGFGSTIFYLTDADPPENTMKSHFKVVKLSRTLLNIYGSVIKQRQKLLIFIFFYFVYLIIQ